MTKRVASGPPFLMSEHLNGSHKEALKMDSNMKPGDPHYRAYIGDPRNYDLIAATTFNLLTTLGLREHHAVLDVGCGSLRNGRLLLPYLLPDRYTGIEPNEWLVREGVKHETGEDIIRLKGAQFSFRADARELSPEDRYDFILLQSIFSHCGEDLITGWLDELAPHLSESGSLIVTWFQAQQNSGESGWLYPGLVRYTEDRFKELVANAGLIYQPLHWPHPIQRWAMLTKSEENVAWVETTGLSFVKAFEQLRPKKHRT